MLNTRSSFVLSGVLVASLIAGLVIAALSALLYEAKAIDISALWQDSYYLHITRFSFYQALLSTLLSLLPAIPIAYALSRRRFVGRSLLLRLCAMTLVLPVLIAVFGLISIYGNQGLLVQTLSLLGITPSISIYGLQGILLAHVFLNLPLACRLLLQSLEGIPAEQHLLAAHLGLRGWSRFRLVAWPRLRQQLPHAAGLIFMLCFTSFAVVMALGGGPQATTIELAIYQALRYDFDLAGGALLALWQITLCASLVLLTSRFAKPLAVSMQRAAEQPRLFDDSRRARLWDSLWIALLVLLILPPMLAVIGAGLNSHLLDELSRPALWQAAVTSLKVAVLAGILALVAGTAILLTSRYWRCQQQIWRADGIELIGTIILITPGLVMSTGLFLLLRHYTNAYSLAFVVVVVVNTLMALPYVIKTLSQPLWHIALQYDRLCASLGIRGLTRLRLIEWRALRRPFAQALAISSVLSLGDLSAIALFGSRDMQTLPLYLFQQLGSYQMAGAAVTALLLLLISLALFAIIETCIIKGRTPC